jgi:hypothetical protein
LAARQQRDQMIHLLIRVIETARQEALAGQPVEGNAQWIALFLLGEFKATQALPAIRAVMSLPDKLSFNLFGDTITEVLDRVLLAVIGDQLSVYDELISDESLNEYARWGAVTAVLRLVRGGRLTREQAVGSLHAHLKASIESDKETLTLALASSLCDLGAREAQVDLEKAWDAGLIDPFFMRREHMESDLLQSPDEVGERLQRRDNDDIDAVKEVQYWLSNNEEDELLPPEQFVPEPHFLEPRQNLAPVEKPVLRSAAKVGRNDPCPCGSGQKFKRCCGGR